MFTVTRNTVTRAATTFALAAILAGVGGAGIANADPVEARSPGPVSISTVDESATGTADDGNTNTTSSRRITVTNMTSDIMKLMDVVGTGAFDG
jgi:hypothetical protein